MYTLKGRVFGRLRSSVWIKNVKSIICFFLLEWFTHIGQRAGEITVFNQFLFLLWRLMKTLKQYIFCCSCLLVLNVIAYHVTSSWYIYYLFLKKIDHNKLRNWLKSTRSSSKKYNRSMDLIGLTLDFQVVTLFKVIFTKIVCSSKL